MRIRSLEVRGAHGFLDLHLRFNDDLSFLTGVNGSGKTTALRMLMALLMPSADELETMTFKSAIAVVRDGNVDVAVGAKKSEDLITISVTGVDKPTVLKRRELQYTIDARRREEYVPASRPIRNAVFDRISQIATPMFLGIDRRFRVPNLPRSLPAEARRRDYYFRRQAAGDALASQGPEWAILEAAYLVEQKMQAVLAAQEQLDERLRNEIFVKAFEYRDSHLGRSLSPPSRQDVETYRNQLERIKEAAGSTRIPVPEIQLALDRFFVRLNTVVASLETSRPGASAAPVTKSGSGKQRERRPWMWEHPMNEHFIEWMINKPQADRIVEHLELLDKYIRDRDDLRQPLDRFLGLVNSFFQQTGKEALLADNGRLAIRLRSSSSDHAVRSLSSGEGQLLVMLAHLSLNPSLSGSSVFIVDEPELSLHVDWQERFVDAVLEANPDVQVIMATHSPAIILDRDEACVPMAAMAHD